MTSDDRRYDQRERDDDGQVRDVIPWHVLFAAALDLALSQVHVKVESEVPMPKLPPKIDVILIRPEGTEWTREQSARLCDGIRDSAAGQINIELKYTESVNEMVLMKAMGTFAHTVTNRKEGEPEVNAFVVSSKTPTSKLIDALYKEVMPGVLRSEEPGYRHVAIISLNDLAPEEHNLLFKMFASKKEQVVSSFDKIDGPLHDWGNLDLKDLVRGLFQLLTEEDVMPHTLTVENVKDRGRKFAERIIATASLEERLRGLSNKEILQGIPAEERLEGISAEERLEGISAEERLEGISTRKRLQGISAQERLEGLSAEELERLKRVLGA